MALADLVTVDEEGAILNIALNEIFGKVRITGIEMFVCEDDEGDLAVLWDCEPFEDDEDEIENIIEQFYNGHEFDARLKEILIANGVSVAAANTIRGSEYGMQDEGRASYDASELAAELRLVAGM